MFTRLVQLDRLTEKSRKDEILELFGQRHSGDPDRYLGDLTRDTNFNKKIIIMNQFYEYRIYLIFNNLTFFFRFIKVCSITLYLEL